MALTDIDSLFGSLSYPFSQINVFLETVVDFEVKFFLVEVFVEISLNWRFPFEVVHKEVLQEEFASNFLAIPHRIGVNVEVNQWIYFLADTFILES